MFARLAGNAAVNRIAGFAGRTATRVAGRMGPALAGYGGMGAKTLGTRQLGMGMSLWEQGMKQVRGLPSDVMQQQFFGKRAFGMRAQGAGMMRSWARTRGAPIAGVGAGLGLGGFLATRD